jgi:Holliday junction DNA helicase RuvA
MIYSIRGTIADVMPGAVAIENSGIAFRVNVPDNSPAYLAQPGEFVTLYIAMMVREDDISLYGFTDKQSLSMFRLLQTVQGIGAKAALAILSALGVEELKRAIIFGDEAAIQRANGVGKKSAQRVVLELKEKLEKSDEFLASSAAFAPAGGGADSSLVSQAADALMALGYTKSEAMSSLAGIEASSVEEYIRKALKNR